MNILFFFLLNISPALFLVCTHTSTEGCRLVITRFMKANILSDSEPQYSKLAELAAPDLVTRENLAPAEHLFEPVHHLLVPQPLVIPDLAPVA